MANEEILDLGSIRAIDDRAVIALNDESEFEKLLEEFKPFLGSQSSRLAGRSFEMRDEMMEVATFAFLESIRKYDSEKGHFFPFMRTVVKMRLNDALRKQYAMRVETVPLETEDEDGVSLSPHIERASIDAYNEGIRQNNFAIEIEYFKQELADWGITMESLVEHSPKHSRVRDAYRAIIAAVARDEEIMQTILVKRYFPIKKISLLTKVPQKNIERGRTFIIASLIIRVGDYEHLRGYIA